MEQLLPAPVMEPVSFGTAHFHRSQVFQDNAVYTGLSGPIHYPAGKLSYIVLFKSVQFGIKSSEELSTPILPVSGTGAI